MSCIFSAPIGHICISLPTSAHTSKQVPTTLHYLPEGDDEIPGYWQARGGMTSLGDCTGGEAYTLM